MPPSEFFSSMEAVGNDLVLALMQALKQSTRIAVSQAVLAWPTRKARPTNRTTDQIAKRSAKTRRSYPLQTEGFPC